MAEDIVAKVVTTSVEADTDFVSDTRDTAEVGSDMTGRKVSVTKETGTIVSGM